MKHEVPIDWKMIKDYVRKWDYIYTEERKGENLPSVQEDMPKIVKLFKNYKVKRVLDLGCGSGRHLVYLAKHGFDVYGIDISKEGIKNAHDLLKKENLDVNLITASMYYTYLPYRNDYFDGIICLKALHHERIENIRKTIKEIERVLKINGFIYITVRKRVPKRMRLPFIDVAPNTYIPLEGKEKDIFHYLFNKKSLRKEFRDFRIYDLWIDSESYYCLFGQLKQKTE